MKVIEWLLEWLFDWNNSPTPKTKKYIIYSEDTCKIDEDGGPYEVEYVLRSEVESSILKERDVEWIESSGSL